MSHEIRTPLHGILGLTDYLKQQSTNQKVENTLNTISECGNQLLYLLDDLLVISELNEDTFSINVH